jgi:tRNA (guanine6-N2)-methyltransferase
MAIYASTFISGLQDPVSKELTNLIPDLRIMDLYDGLVVYSTNIHVQKIKNIKFFNNTFLVLKKFYNLQNSNLNNIIKMCLNMGNIKPKYAGDIVGGNRTFRIITSKENQLTSVNKNLLRSMEQKIARSYRLTVNRAKPDLEFWFLYRSEKIGFFMLRLTRHTAYEKILNKGELRPELSHILCLLSEPSPNDIVLDPFCGYGSIPIARATDFPCNMIFASDIDKQMVNILKNKLKKQKLKKPIFVKEADALNMESVFEDNFIDKIITDPPWGFYQHMDIDINVFYKKMLQEFYRILKPNGILVLLTARKKEFENSLADCQNKYKLVDKYHILVSGKKAAIYKIIKKIK